MLPSCYQENPAWPPGCVFGGWPPGYAIAYQAKRSWRRLESSSAGPPVIRPDALEPALFISLSAQR